MRPMFPAHASSSVRVSEAQDQAAAAHTSAEQALSLPPTDDVQCLSLFLLPRTAAIKYAHEQCGGHG